MILRDTKLLARKIEETPRLSAREEAELARRYKNGDMSAAHELIISHLRFVHHIARRYGKDGHTMADLFQEGTVGLMEAIKRFNPDRGVRLSTYAMWWIRASIQDHVIRSRSLVKIGTTAAQKAMFFNLRRRLSGITDLESLSDEIARSVAGRFNTSVEEVRRFARRIARPDRTLDMPVSAGGDDTWLDYVADADPDPEERFSLVHESRALWTAMANGLANLPPRERLIIRQRFFADPTSSRAALGAQLGLSKERVRQLEIRALDRLKDVVTSMVTDAAERAAPLLR